MEATRNQQIANSMERLQTPILPFELTLAVDAMRGHVEKQSSLGEAMGEAMSQTSETWHDNAAAEAITSASQVLEGQARRTMGILSTNEVFAYPEAECEEVTLGSIVDVTYGSSTYVERLVLTGVSRELPIDLNEKVIADDDIDVITLASPIGTAILGRKAGDHVAYTTPTGRELTLHIVAISQLSA